jgi:hypothetical protein
MVGNHFYLEHLRIVSFIVFAVFNLETHVFFSSETFSSLISFFLDVLRFEFGLTLAM